MKSAYLIFLAVPFVIAYFLTPIVKLLAEKLKIVDEPDARKVHTTIKPRFGGIAIYVAFIAGIIFANFVFGFTSSESRTLALILIGGTLVFAIGAFDDIKRISPLPKLIVQCISAIIIVSLGIKASLFIYNPVITFIISVVWIVGITNSFNLLDNMDGLSAGCAVISLVIFAIIGIQNGETLVTVVSLTLSGALLGFLRFNINPSKIFMGDSGALLIGFVISAIALDCTYVRGSGLRHLPVISPLLVLGVPIFDTVSVMFIRWRNKMPLFGADKNHFSHRLLTLGMNQKEAVIFIYVVAFCVGIGAIFLTTINRMQAIILLIQELAIFAIIVVLMEIAGKKMKLIIRDKNNFREE